MERYRLVAVGVLVGLVLGLSSVAFDADAATWQIQDGVYVPQATAALTCEILPGEDMDAHTITWGPNSNVRFWPSWNWGTPLPGDILCWLYDSSTAIVWWQGTFFAPSTTITIQLSGCDSNDGWVDIYVDGILEFSYNTWHAVSTNVRLIGSGFPNAVHTVELHTRLSGGDVSLDYAAAGAGPSALGLTTWGQIKGLYR